MNPGHPIPYLLVGFIGEGEGPIQRHEGLFDAGSERRDAGLVAYEVGLQRGLRGEDWVAFDVRVIAQEHLGDQRLIVLGVDPKVDMLRSHHGSVCRTHDLPPRSDPWR